MPIKSYQRYAVAAIPLLVIGLLVYYFSDIVTYIVLAWILSMVGAPINRWLTPYLGKSAAAIGTILSFAIILLAILWIFIPPIVQQARNFTNVDYEQLANSFEEPLADWNQWLVDKGMLPEKKDINATLEQARSEQEKLNFEIVSIDSILRNEGDSLRTGITIVLNVNQPKDDNQVANENSVEMIQSTDDFFTRAKKNILQFLNPTRITGIFGSIVGFLGNLMITILSVLFISFFFLKEQGLFTKIIKAIVPNEFEDQTVHAIDESANMLIRYFIGITIQVIMITIYVSIALGLLDFQNVLLIAFFAALMNIIPYLGPFIGATFGVIIVVSANLDVSFYQVLLPKILKLLAVFASMQLLDNFILQPNIFSKSVKAHPLEIFIIVLVGAKIGGVVGMILAIPAYTVLRVLAKVFLSEFKVVQRITQNL
jgi:predicted PurR-regulated permease PerM